MVLPARGKGTMMPAASRHGNHWRAGLLCTKTFGRRSPHFSDFLLIFKQSFEMIPMHRQWRVSLLLLLTAGLVACGPPKKSVFPPTVSIQQLKVLPDGQWQLTVRIQNNSYGEMDFMSLDGQLQMADLVPVRLHSTFELDIPALVGDVTMLDVLPTPAMTKALQMVAAKGSAGSLGYRVKGSTNAKPEQEKAARDFDFSGNDFLSPTPGAPNTYR
jgi:hypothetical protein